MMIKTLSFLSFYLLDKKCLNENKTCMEMSWHATYLHLNKYDTFNIYLTYLFQNSNTLQVTSISI